ncbi:MAG: M28 family peptidase [Spirochaetes bacterium]|jgi:Zn-dependent M28 family amino/carboxypeptidase|nr:M28 family peptidase [Spirochaetota bacterium]
MRLFLKLYDAVTGRDKIVVNCRHIVCALADYIGERSLAQFGNLVRAAEFIESAFALHGSKPVKENFTVSGHKVANIVAEIPGKKSSKGVIIIGAHYDTVEGSPGANDNGSGVAALLELHRLLKKEEHARTIRFVAFAMEEPPFFGTEQMGSFVYANKCRKKKETIDLMICLDMLGVGGRFLKQNYPIDDMRIKYPQKGNFVAVATLPSQSRTAFFIKRLFNRHSFIKMFEMIAPASVPGIDHSDHSSFIKNGYAAVMITDTGFYRNVHYHGEGDTSSTLNYRFLGYNVYSLYRMIRDLADGRKIPR